MSNSCSILTEILRNIEPSELNEVSEISKSFNEFLISVFNNDFADGLMKSLDWLNFSDNKKDLIMTIFKINPDYDLESLKGLDESHILEAYLKLTGLSLEYEGANPCLKLDEGLNFNPYYKGIVTFSYPIPRFLLDKGLILDFTDLRSLESLRGLPEGLEQLSIDSCNNLESLEGVKEGLKVLNIRRCKSLESLRGLPEGLEQVTIKDCDELESLEGVKEGLKVLNIRSCKSLESLRGLPEGLEQVSIDSCYNLESLEGLQAGLKVLNIEWINLGSLKGLPAGLEQVTIKDCDGLESLEGLPSALKQLTICVLSKLKSLQGLSEGLEQLSIDSCNNLESLRGLPEGLEELFIKDCSKLQTTECLAVLARLQDGKRRVAIHECPNY